MTVANTGGELRRHALYGATASAGIAAIGVASGILAARLLGPAARGEFLFYQVLVTTIALVATQGLGDALTFGVKSELGPPAQVRHLAWRRSHVGSIVAMGLAAVIIVAIPRITDVGFVAGPVAVGYALTVPLLVFLTMAQFDLRTDDRIGPWLWARVAPGGAWLVAVAAIGVVGGSQRSRLVLVMAVYTGFLVVLCVVLGCRYHFTRLLRARPVSPAVSEPVVSYGRKVVLTFGVERTSAQFDQFLLPFFVTADRIGYYGVALAWSGGSQIGAIGCGLLILPRLAGRDPQPRLPGEVGLAVAASVAGGLAGVVLAPAMLPAVFGADFAQAVGLGQLLSVAAAVGGVRHALREWAKALGRVSPVFYSEIVTLVVSGCCWALLLAPLGTEGAALTVTIANGAGTAVLAASLLTHVLRRDETRPVERRHLTAKPSPTSTISSR